MKILLLNDGGGCELKAWLSRDSETINISIQCELHQVKTEEVISLDKEDIDDLICELTALRNKM